MAIVVVSCCYLKLHYLHQEKTLNVLNETHNTQKFAYFEARFYLNSRERQSLKFFFLCGTGMVLFILTQVELD